MAGVIITDRMQQALWPMTIKRNIFILTKLFVCELIAYLLKEYGESGFTEVVDSLSDESDDTLGGREGVTLSVYSGFTSESSSGDVSLGGLCFPNLIRFFTLFFRVRPLELQK